MTITKVSMEQILPNRQKVMWPKKSIYFIRIPDDSQGLHFGLFEGEKWSLWCLFLFWIIKHNSGNLPLWNSIKERVMDQIFFSLFFLEEKNVDRIWCNARISKSGFYQKFGMTGTVFTFEKEGIGYVVMERYFQSQGI